MIKTFKRFGDSLSIVSSRVEDRLESLERTFSYIAAILGASIVIIAGFAVFGVILSGIYGE